MSKIENPLMCPRCRSKAWFKESVRYTGKPKGPLILNPVEIYDTLATFTSNMDDSVKLTVLVQNIGMDPNDAEILIRHQKGEQIVGIALKTGISVERVMMTIKFLPSNPNRDTPNDIPVGERKIQNIDNFSETHIYYILSLLTKDSHTSTAKLSEATGIDEKNIKNIITILNSRHLIHGNNMRITISEAGYRLLKNIPMKPIFMEKTNYAVGRVQRTMLIRGVADKIANGTQQRDQGKAAGADGASVFIMKNGKLMMPKEWDMDSRDPEYAQLLRSTGISENDVLIISGAENENTAMLAVISIALELLW